MHRSHARARTPGGTALVRSGVQYNNKTMRHHFGAAHSCSSFTDRPLPPVGPSLPAPTHRKSPDRKSGGSPRTAAGRTCRRSPTGPARDLSSVRKRASPNVNFIIPIANTYVLLYGRRNLILRYVVSSRSPRVTHFTLPGPHTNVCNKRRPIQIAENRRKSPKI